MPGEYYSVLSEKWSLDHALHCVPACIALKDLKRPQATAALLGPQR